MVIFLLFLGVAAALMVTARKKERSAVSALREENVAYKPDNTVVGNGIGCLAWTATIFTLVIVILFAFGVRSTDMQQSGDAFTRDTFGDNTVYIDDYRDEDGNVDYSAYSAAVKDHFADVVNGD